MKDYNYSSNGYYFVTICTKEKKLLFGKIDVGANCVRPLTDCGTIVENEIAVLNNAYENVEVIKYVVMPNHIHMIIAITCGDDGRTQFAPTLSRIIKQFKGAVTKKIGEQIWQKSFHDHIIRNGQSYRKIWRYIDENPLKWHEDCYYTPTDTVRQM